MSLIQCSSCSLREQTPQIDSISSNHSLSCLRFGSIFLDRLIQPRPAGSLTETSSFWIRTSIAADGLTSRSWAGYVRRVLRVWVRWDHTRTTVEEQRAWLRDMKNEWFGFGRSSACSFVQRLSVAQILNPKCRSERIQKIVDWKKKKYFSVHNMKSHMKQIFHEFKVWEIFCK